MFESIPHADLFEAALEQAEYLHEHVRQCYRNVWSCKECWRYRAMIDLLVYNGAWETVRFEEQTRSAHLKAMAVGVGTALAKLQGGL